MISKETVFGSGSVAAILDALVNSGDLLLMVGDVAFIPISVAFGSIVPYVPWLDQATMQPIVVFVAALYVVNLLVTRYERYVKDND